MDIYKDVLFPIFGATLEALLVLLPYGLFLLCIALIAFLVFNHFYKKGTYYKITHNPYITTRLDPGKYGEYLTYKELRLYETAGGRFLFNLYIPKEDEETTEIDVILICRGGVFVFESKNYSGWIFGNENQSKWTQTLPRGHGQGKSQKEHFYNPIMQNKSHIKHLRAIVGEDVPLYSMILFSNRCTLKNVTVKDSGVPVINRQDAERTVFGVLRKTETELTAKRVEELYALLYPFSQTDGTVKAEHIARIKEKTEPTTESASESAPGPAAEETVPEDTTLTCPRCGSKLVLRTAKRGDRAGKQFYGCSKYPACKYTRDI